MVAGLSFGGMGTQMMGCKTLSGLDSRNSSTPDMYILPPGVVIGWMSIDPHRDEYIRYVSHVTYLLISRSRDEKITGVSMNAEQGHILYCIVRLR